MILGKDLVSLTLFSYSLYLKQRVMVGSSMYLYIPKSHSHNIMHAASEKLSSINACMYLILLCIFLTCAVESSSSGVPIDDLSILRGCVSRNRAVFSPTPLIHKQSVKLTGTWPDLISSHEFRSPLISNHNSADGSHGDQPVDTKYSVSVQLKRVGCCETSLPNNQSSLSRSNHPGIPQCEEPSLGDSNHLQLFTNSLSTPSRLNSPSLRLFKLADYASESHSSCSCAAYMSERMITDSIGIPVARTKSLDGRETVKGLSQKSHRKGKIISNNVF